MENTVDFVKAVANQDRKRLAEFFHDNAVIKWHCTNEVFTLEEYLTANCEYPGKWQSDIESIYQTGDLTVIVTQVAPEEGGQTYHCVSFIRCDGGKIRFLDEYWADDGAPPAWRVKMKIGKPINER